MLTGAGTYIALRGSKVLPKGGNNQVREFLGLRKATRVGPEWGCAPNSFCVLFFLSYYLGVLIRNETVKMVT